jgi:putative acetyltransferase
MELTHLGIEEREDLLPALLDVWESSVRATHNFLREGDVDFLRPYVEHGLREIPVLFCVVEAGLPLAFLGIAGDSIEMLFVHADSRHKGIGSTLMREALARGACHVDVNEQNPQALDFYQRFGFEVVSRDAVDSLRLPYPILHCSLPERD